MGRYSWIRTLFLALMALSAAGFGAYQWFVVRPEKACSARAAWYDPETRICATPLVVSDVTGRPIGKPRTPEQVAAGQARARGETRPGAEASAPTGPTAPQAR